MLATWGTSTGRNPTLDLQFAGATSLDNRITFSRGTTATYFNSAGVLTTAGTSEARFDYNPSTLAAQGLLIEEQRTNVVASSVYTANTNGWTNGVAGGGTGTIVSAAVNSPAGTTAGVFNISGLNTSGYVGNFSVTTSSSNARAGSVFVKNNGGVKFQLRLVFQTGGTFLSYGTEYDFNTGTFQDGIAGTTAPTSRSAENVGNGWLRITIVGPDNGTGNTSTALLFYGGATTTNYNYLFWGAQIEQGASGASASVATSYIPTTTTALTRNADVASMTGTNFSSWYNQSAGTFLTVYSLARPSSGSNQFTARASDNGYNNSVAMNTNGTGFAAIATASGGVFDGVASAATPLTANVTARVAGCYATNDLALSFNGAAVVTDTSATIPTTLTRLDIGSDHAGVNRIQGGYIQRITYYPVRLPNSTLQALTA